MRLAMSAFGTKRTSAVPHTRPLPGWEHCGVLFLFSYQSLRHSAAAEDFVSVLGFQNRLLQPQGRVNPLLPPN
jgi:hypothetical protein